MPLLWALRDVVGLTGTKFGCGVALCGACTVHLDGRPIRSCITPVASVAGKSSHDHRSDRRDTQAARRSSKPGLTWRWFSAATVSPARSCPPQRCIESNPNPSDAEIDAAMSGNICRCGTYPRIRAAIKQASQSA